METDTYSNTYSRTVLTDYFDEFHQKPTLKVWKPTEFDLKYYCTPRRLAKETEKRNEEYQRAYARENERYFALKNAIVEITSIHPALSEFFAESAVVYVDQSRSHRSKLLRQIRDYETANTRRVEFTYTPLNVNDAPYKTDFDFMDAIGRIRDVCYSRKNDALLPYDPRHDYVWARLRALASDDAGQLAIIRGYEQYLKWEDDLRTSPTPAMVFDDLIEHFVRIASKIVEVLGGKPDAVSLDQHFGDGGHYNGIVAREGKRASFKSFFAGGYNIQRLHVRFRITILKN